MTTVEIYKIEEVGEDYVVFNNAQQRVRVDFSDEKVYPYFTKEDRAADFRRLIGKDSALPYPVSASSEAGYLSIAVGIQRTAENEARVHEMHVSFSSIEIFGVGQAVGGWSTLSAPRRF
ncbi:MAG: hypothetical protein WB994_13370 [Candidatus Acidiferrum sp.]